MKKLILVISLSCVFAAAALALFDTGTALEKGKLEADVCLNPFDSIGYGQNFIFLHYGLGNYYELHGYLSKWGAVSRWDNSTYEGYIGILKQWLAWPKLDLATVVGVRKVFNSFNPSLIGPGILYTFRVTPRFRLAGHLQYIGDISSQGHLIISNYNLGYTSELGGYYKFNENFELAAGIFTNSTGDPRPIYTLNYYF